jgi:hypothetical protein
MATTGAPASPVVGGVDLHPGSLPALLLNGAITPPRFVVLRLKPATADVQTLWFEEFGQEFRLFAVGGGDWELARVHPDGSETYMGKTRDLLGWRPSGAPVGGW